MESSGILTIVYVSDMGRSVEFYRDKLSLTVSSHPSELDLSGETWVTFGFGTGTLALHSGGCDQAERRKAVQVGVMVKDIVTAREAAISNGVDFSEIDSPHPGVLICSTSDPDGLTVFYQQG